jgi:hypothetical protein
MTAPLFVRRYLPDDRAACLALFASNVPSSFLVEEEPMFADFLDQMPGPYLVVEDTAGRLIACGGVATRDGVEATAPRRAELEARLSATLAQGHRLGDGVLTVE